MQVKCKTIEPEKQISQAHPSLSPLILILFPGAITLVTPVPY